MIEFSNRNNKSKSVAFSGHRSFKLGGSTTDFDQIRASLRATLVSLCEQGYDTFYTGMAEGFDIVAAEEVISLRREFNNIKLIAVIPFAAQSKGYSRPTIDRYVNVLGSADEKHILSGQYHAACFHERNNYLVDNSSALVCYYNGSSGGTRYTVERAKKVGMQIINLDPDYIIDRQLSLAI